MHTWPRLRIYALSLTTELSHLIKLALLNRKRLTYDCGIGLCNLAALNLERVGNNRDA